MRELIGEDPRMWEKEPKRKNKTERAFSDEIMDGIG
jgi:hypothetical protein